MPQEVQREIQILSENDHPFLMQMVHALVDLQGLRVYRGYNWGYIGIDRGYIGCMGVYRDIYGIYREVQGLNLHDGGLRG